MDPDGPLVERARRGDGEAFAVLVRRHEARVYGLCRRILGQPEWAEDVAQEIFVRAFVGLGRFRGEASFGTWLYRIALNELRTTLRRLAGGDTVAPRARSVAGPEEEAMRGETRARVRAVLHTLPPEERELLWLRDVEGLPYEEIARILDKPLGTVKSALHRARLRFSAAYRRAVGKEGGQPA